MVAVLCYQKHLVSWMHKILAGRRCYCRLFTEAVAAAANGCAEVVYSYTGGVRAKAKAAQVKLIKLNLGSMLKENVVYLFYRFFDR